MVRQMATLKCSHTIHKAEVTPHGITIRKAEVWLNMNVMTILPKPKMSHGHRVDTMRLCNPSADC
jgi:hypothetical protein